MQNKNYFRALCRKMLKRRIVETSVKCENVDTLPVSQALP